MNIQFFRTFLSSTNLSSVLPRGVFEKIDPKGFATSHKRIFDLVRMSETQLLALPGVGPKSVSAIKRWLAGHGLRLGMRINVLEWLEELERAEHIRAYRVYAGDPHDKSDWLKSFAAAVKAGEDSFEAELRLHSDCYLIRTTVRARVEVHSFAEYLCSQNGNFWGYTGRLQVCTGEKHTECPTFFNALARIDFPRMYDSPNKEDGYLWVDKRGTNQPGVSMRDSLDLIRWKPFRLLALKDDD